MIRNTIITAIACCLFASCGKNWNPFNPKEIDKKSPTIAITSPGAGGTTVTTTSNTITVSGTASDNVAMSKVSFALTGATGLFGDATSSDGWSTWSAADLPLNEGLTIITLTARDAAGNKTSVMLQVNKGSRFASFAFPTSRLRYSDKKWSVDESTGLVDTTYTGILTVDNLGDTAIAGTPVKKIQSVCNPGYQQTAPDTFLDYVACTDSGWMILAHKQTGSSLALLKPTKNMQDSVVVDPIGYLTIKFPLNSNYSWKTRRNAQVYSLKTVQGEESITTPAGVFDCVHVYADLLVTYAVTDLYADQWYAPEVGLVKQKISYGKRDAMQASVTYQEMELISVGQ